MSRLPSLALLAEEAAAELAAQERRADALDSKAAVVLGFAGVLVPLTLSSLSGVFAIAGAGFAALAATCAAAATMPPRSATALGIWQLRDEYLRSDEELTRLRLLDTRASLCEDMDRLLHVKARLVGAGAVAQGFAIVLAVIAGTLGGL